MLMQQMIYYTYLSYYKIKTDGPVQYHVEF
jgi:hypothetical protein